MFTVPRNPMRSVAIVGVGLRHVATGSGTGPSNQLRQDPTLQGIPIDQEGGLCSADSAVGEKYIRTQMKYNKVNNIIFYGCALIPFVILPYYYMSRATRIWDRWSDPYGLPSGFDPNKDAAPDFTSAASSGAQPPKSMMSLSAPGSFSMKRGEKPVETPR